MMHVNPKPVRNTPPGVTILDEIQERGWSQSQFAKILGRPPQFVSELINGKRQLTAETAIQLEAALEVDARFWMTREANYRLALQEKEATVDRDGILRRREEIARPGAAA